MENRLSTLALPEASRTQVLAVASQYASEVRSHFGDRLRDIRLFGSAARGDWNRDSDVDVLVLLDSVSEADSDWLVRRALRLGLLENHLLLQPAILPEHEFVELRARERRFAVDIETEGRRL